MHNTETSTGAGTPSVEIVDRIRKLLKVAAHGSGATEAEAATALEMAQKLLLKYNLESVNMDADGQARAEPIDHESISLTNEDCRRGLLRAVADANFCRVIGIQLSAADHYKTWIQATVYLVGKPTNRAAVIEMFNWVLAQIEGAPTGTLDKYGKPKLAGGLYQESWKLKPVSNDPKSWKDWRYGFFTGITARMVERLGEMTAKQAINVPGAMALMKTSELAVKSYWATEWGMRVQHRPQGTNASGVAMGIGYEAGNRVTITKSALGGGMPRLGGG